MSPSNFLPNAAFAPHRYQHWYIACDTKALRQKPISRTVLGLPLVLFRGSQNQPIALLDRCPHRNVPLSQGRLDRASSNHTFDRTSDRTSNRTSNRTQQQPATHLICRYHGWQFNEQGQCQRIPGRCAVTDAAGSNPSDSYGSRNAIAYPTIEQQGFVWVYPYSSSTPPTQQPYTFPYLSHPHFATARWKIRANATLANAAENFLDATHTHFVHAGLIRSDKQRRLVNVKVARYQRSVEAIYAGEQQLSGLLYRLLAPGCCELISTGRFILPAIAQIEYQTDRHYRLLISLFITPTTSQQLTAYCVVTFRWGTLNSLGRLLAKPLFYRAMQQDLAILKAQTENINRFKKESFAYTELDLLRPHIDALLAKPAACSANEDRCPLSKTALSEATISVQL